MSYPDVVQWGFVLCLFVFTGPCVVQRKVRTEDCSCSTVYIPPRKGPRTRRPARRSWKSPKRINPTETKCGSTFRFNEVSSVGCTVPFLSTPEELSKQSVFCKKCVGKLLYWVFYDSPSFLYNRP